MVGFRPGTARCRRLPGRVSGLATAIGVLLLAAGYQAGPGWDPVTGWGSPDAQVLIPLLARYGLDV